MMIDDINWWALLGLFGGLMGGAAGIIGSRQMLKRKHALDERYWQIERMAKTASWWWTLAALVVLYTLVILEIIDRAIWVVNTLYIVHVIGYSVSIFYYNRKL